MGSLLDSLIDVEQMVDRTIELGLPASCITDHGTNYAFFRHYKYAMKKGQKPIIGFEAYIVDDRTVKSSTQEVDDANITKRNHLILLAKNNNGLKKLHRICSEGWLTGFYYRPRIDNSVLEQYMDTNDDDLICASACLAGSVPQAILANDMDKAKELIRYYQNLFHGNYWLEIQPCPLYEQYVVNKAIIELGKEMSVPIIVSTDAHYLYQSDKRTHDVLLCLQSKKTITSPDAWSFQGNTYYLMSRDELEQSFTTKWRYKKILKQSKKKNSSQTKTAFVYDYEGDKFEHPETIPDFVQILDEGQCDYNDLNQDIIHEAIDETVNVANQCNVTIEMGKHYLPKVEIDENDEDFVKHRASFAQQRKCTDVAGDYLRYLCIKNLIKRGLVQKEYIDRLNHELDVINTMGFNSYFLIYYDLMHWCHEQNIATGPGRGCFDGNNIVMTSDGYKQLKDINVNDEVQGEDDEYRPVLLKHEYNIDENVIDIDVGQRKICGVTEDHLILAIKKVDYQNGIRTPQWYEASELQDGDVVAINESEEKDNG